MLCKKLGVPRKNIKDKNDKGRICNFLIKQNNQQGLIDDDPHSPNPLSLAYFREKLPSKYGIKQLVDKNDNELIVISPRLEGWLIQVCNANGVDISKEPFGLPNTDKSLHKDINGKLFKLEVLLDYLLEIKAPEILYLQSLLKKKS